MPKKIDPALRERAVRLVREHRSEYSSTTAAAVAVARQLGVARESVRRWVAQAEIDDGARPGTASEEGLSAALCKCVTGWSSVRPGRAGRGT
jgi:transposase